MNWKFKAAAVAIYLAFTFGAIWAVTVIAKY